MRIPSKGDGSRPCEICRFAGNVALLNLGRGSGVYRPGRSTGADDLAL